MGIVNLTHQLLESALSNRPTHTHTHTPATERVKCIESHAMLLKASVASLE
jgi:hypothetical protein